MILERGHIWLRANQKTIVVLVLVINVEVGMVAPLIPVVALARIIKIVHILATGESIALIKQSRVRAALELALSGGIVVASAIARLMVGVAAVGLRVVVTHVLVQCVNTRGVNDLVIEYDFMFYTYKSNIIYI